MKGKIKVGDLIRIANVDPAYEWMNDPMTVFDDNHPVPIGGSGMHIDRILKNPEWYEKVKGKHLAFYEECMETGNLKYGNSRIGSGLCQSARDGYIDSALLSRFVPTEEDEDFLDAEHLSTGWWGSGLDWQDSKKYTSFTPLRQTIVLFMAAINGEL